MNDHRRLRGELEAQVMRVLWDAADALTAKDIVTLLPSPTPAHTTVLTALDRLGTKGLVRREGESPRGLRFAPTRSEEEHVSLAMLQRLESSRDRDAALLHFAGSLGPHDLELLQRAVDGRR